MLLSSCNFWRCNAHFAPVVAAHAIAAVAVGGGREVIFVDGISSGATIALDIAMSEFLGRDTSDIRPCARRVTSALRRFVIGSMVLHYTSARYIAQLHKRRAGRYQLLRRNRRQGLGPAAKRAAMPPPKIFVDGHSHHYTTYFASRPTKSHAGRPCARRLVVRRRLKHPGRRA